MSDFPSLDSWLEHRVSYGETDAMGYVYYGNYLHYFERGRGQFIRERGMSYNEVEKRGLFLPVREAHCRYRRPARYDELIWVHTGLAEFGRASITFVYEVLDEAKTVLMTTGTTQHACVDGNGQPVKVPDWLKSLFA